MAVTTLFGTEHLSTKRVIIKIVQVVIGVILSFMICKHWDHGYHGCYGDGIITGSIGALNYIFLILNIIWFILNLINIGCCTFESICAIACTVLYFSALGLLILYFIVEHHFYDIVGVVLIGVMGGLYLWDVTILLGEWER